jgi:flagellar hook capping protein FlgD
MTPRRALVLLFTLFVSANASARPLDQSRAMPKIKAIDPSGQAVDHLPRIDAVMGAAVAGTTFFGGTFWAADSQRWEAYKDQLWTFDSGVGSSLVPAGGAGSLSQPTASWVNPYKEPGLHATMEGWVGIDFTYSELAYFRRVGSGDVRFGATKCVGSAGGLGGLYSFWCGVFPAEASELCYASGQGYGNAWSLCIERSFSYGGGLVTLGFDYRNETEDGYDYTYVYVDTTGNGDNVEVASYTGTSSGTASLPLSQGAQLPRIPKPIKIKFCVFSDGAWSDQDGLNPTACGAFAVDNISLTGAIVHTATFESSDDGWSLSTPPPGRGGEWANIRDLSDLPPPLSLAGCTCALDDSVLLLANDQNGHGNYADNVAISPWIDLKAYGAMSSGKIIKFNTYYDLPLRNYIFTEFAAQWYPQTCTVTGKLVRSPVTVIPQIIYFFTSSVFCTSRLNSFGTQIDISGIVPPSAEEVRIALGVVSWCRFYPNCTQMTNSTPWYDYVGLGVYGNPGVPVIFADDIDRAQDNFPENGSLSLYATGRVDSNNIQGDSQPEIGTTLGDTLTVTGAVGNAEVYVHFRVTPGPGTHPSRFQAWYGSHAVSNLDSNFRMARMDSAEFGNSGALSGSWMTAYHESDPNFWGSDRDLDPNDLTPTGGMWRLSNDIFPDDLFTAGTRLDYFYSANTIGQANYARDPASGYYEMEILPTSMTSTSRWNCVLYVDHSSRRGRGFIETALTSLLGTGSENFETTNWDRYDVNAATSQQASFGRPLQTDYGATVPQAMGYRTILWDSGNLNAFNLTKEDADILLPWLTLSGYVGEHHLYLSGDGLVFSAISEGASEPSAKQLVEQMAGVSILTNCSTGTYRNANCPTSGAPQDATPCVNLDPVSGSLVANHPARTVGHLGEGNGCPELRSFDVLAPLAVERGTVTGDERYSSPIKSASYASIATTVPHDPVNPLPWYKIVTDGVAVSERRDSGTPCDYLLGGTTSVEERLNEVLTYFGLLPSQCADTMVGLGIPSEGPKPDNILTTLGEFSPNPFAPGPRGRVRFTMEKDAPARLDVFDLQGRLVRTVFDGPAKRGDNDTGWDGRDAFGAVVGNGVYFYRFRALDQDQTRKLVIVGGGN